MREVFAANAELKFAPTDAGDFEGEIEGVGSVYNVVDSHGDLILPGAFSEAIADYKSRNVPMPMFAEHSAYLGGDPLPVGVWTQMEETPAGLSLKGRLVGLDHPDVKRVGECLKANLLRGLSIAFPTPVESNVKRGRIPGEPRRTIKQLGLLSVDLVGDPSNHLARVTGLRAVGTGLSVMGDQQSAVDGITKAMALCAESLAGGNSPTVEQRSDLFRHLSRAHKALTGEDMPPGLKSGTPSTIRDFEHQLGMVARLLGWDWSNTQLRAVAGHGFTAALRDEGGTKSAPRKPDLTSVRSLRTAIEGFTL
jgi:HK97 family phage prohead protease